MPELRPAAQVGPTGLTPAAWISMPGMRRTPFGWIGAGAWETRAARRARWAAPPSRSPGPGGGVAGGAARRSSSAPPARASRRPRGGGRRAALIGPAVTVVAAATWAVLLRPRPALFAPRLSGRDRLVTNEFAHWNPRTPGTHVSRDWDVTSGSLFVHRGVAWTGVPD